MTDNQVLPRSLDPLPDESLPGYLLRLGHRLGVAPLRLARTAGLAIRDGAIPASCMLALQPDTTARFAHVMRLSTAEVTSLTLASLSTRYPPVNPQFSFSKGRGGRQRRIRGVFVKENWILSRSSRYCPQCLAGDESPVQQRHGGAWNKLWRLPVVFACPIHRRLLEHICPACRQPALQRGIGGALLPGQTNSALHPTQCRNPAADNDRRPCGHRLDLSRPCTPPTGRDLRSLLDLQDHLLRLLRHDDPTSSTGQPATPAQYFIDLRVLACLITASWPATRHLIDDAGHAELINDHANDVHNQIDRIRRSGARARDYALYDKPPLDPAIGAALLAAAHKLTQAADPDTARQTLQPLLDTAPGRRRNWVRQFLPGNGYCSPGLHTALGPQVDTTVPPTVQRPQPPRPVRFGVRHVPQRIPPDWINTYFADFGDLKPRHLHHVIAARLAQLSLGGPAALAAIPLGLSQRSTTAALDIVGKVLADTSRSEAFDQALTALADHLDTIEHLTDYGKRRHALAAWSIPASDWATLIDGLPTAHYIYAEWRQIAWDEPKRVLSSVWIWYTITHGDHIYAPPLRPDPQAPHRRTETAKIVQTRWPHISSHPGIYQRLRERLVPYADNLIREIGAGAPRAGSWRPAASPRFSTAVGEDPQR